MRRRLIVALAILVIAGALLVARHRRLQRAGGMAGHGPAAAGVDYRMTPVLAGYEAPDGGTPCETAYNALVAADQAAKAAGMTVPWGTLPDRATILARCSALPPQEQECMQPRYVARNRAACDPILRRYDEHNPLLAPDDGGP